MEKQRFFKRKTSYCGREPTELFICLYGSDLVTPAVVKELCEEALKDFSCLDLEKVWIDKMGKESTLNGMVGIFFNVPEGSSVPDEYRLQNIRY